MKMNKIALSVAVSAMLLAGCATDDEHSGFLADVQSSTPDSKVKTTAVNNSSYAVNDGSEYNNIGYQEVAEIDLSASASAVDELMSSPEFSDAASPLSKRTIYFDYDSSQVLDEFLPVIEAHAQYLLAHPNQRFVLEGHSDQRGSREYNVALAEQRAKSVFNMLQLIGVTESQVDIVSYGEEKPVAMDYNDSAYALNRRVEIVYQ